MSLYITGTVSVLYLMTRDTRCISVDLPSRHEGSLVGIARWNGGSVE